MFENYMPMKFRLPLARCLEKINRPQEIRFRVGRPVTVINDKCEFFLEENGNAAFDAKSALIATGYDLQSILELLVKNSVYAAKEDLRRGFITLEGGHRAGLCGTVVLQGDRIDCLKEISSINLRIASEVKGCATSVFKKTGAENTLLISPPGCGKTTMLRDLSRLLSDSGYHVCIVDERCEIAPMTAGRPVFDIGMRTDVLSGCPKTEGMRMLLRTMNPDILVTDEIGSEQDEKTLYSVVNAGVNVIASFHGFDEQDFYEKTHLAKLFRYLVILSRRNGAGTVERVVRCD